MIHSADRRVAIVTGAGSGIGAAVAERFVKDGVAVVVNDLVEERMAEVVARLRLLGGDAIGVLADVTRRDETQALVDAADANWGRIDVMVTSAGIAGDSSLGNLTEETWDRVIDTNTTAVLHCCQAAAARMGERRSGRIINIASRAWLGWWGQSSYAASKGGVVSLSRALAVELAGRGITSNCVAPGLIDTPMLRSLDESVIARLLAAQPGNRLGTAEDVAHAVAFLADRRAGAITGQVLYCCGGKSVFAMPAPKTSTAAAKNSSGKTPQISQSSTESGPSR